MNTFSWPDSATPSSTLLANAQIICRNYSIGIISMSLVSLLWLAVGSAQPCSGYVLALQQHCLPVPAGMLTYMGCPVFLPVTAVCENSIFRIYSGKQENHPSSCALHGVCSLSSQWSGTAAFQGICCRLMNDRLWIGKDGLDILRGGSFLVSHFG